MDGSKGIRKAVEVVFGSYALVQRCQWHKRENVVGYLSKGTHAHFTELLRRAHNEPTYEGAKRGLQWVKKELSLINEPVARTLEDGLEQTLTLQRLGLFEKLEKTLKITMALIRSEDR